MSEMGEVWNDFRAYNKAKKAMYGFLCPQCEKLRPKAFPTIMLPGQKCKVDGYRDTRPPLTQEQLDKIQIEE